MIFALYVRRRDSLFCDVFVVNHGTDQMIGFVY